jgi:hypothetical protein
MVPVLGSVCDVQGSAFRAIQVAALIPLDVPHASTPFIAIRQE